MTILSFSLKSIAVATVATLSLGSGLVLGSSQNPATAQTLTVQPIQSTPVNARPQGRLPLKASPSIIGTWEGNIHAKGDDVLTPIKVVIASGDNTTWQLMVGNYDQGSGNSSLQNNNVAIELENFAGQDVMLNGVLENNGSKIVGEVAGNGNFVFSLSKK